VSENRVSWTDLCTVLSTRHNVVPSGPRLPRNGSTLQLETSSWVSGTPQVCRHHTQRHGKLSLPFLHHKCTCVRFVLTTVTNSLLFSSFIPGAERFESLSRVYYHGARAAIVCFDATSRHSWKKLRFWVGELVDAEPSCEIFFAVSKCDLWLREAAEYLPIRVSPAHHGVEEGSPPSAAATEPPQPPQQQPSTSKHAMDPVSLASPVAAIPKEEGVGVCPPSTSHTTATTSHCPNLPPSVPPTDVAPEEANLEAPGGVPGASVVPRGMIVVTVVDGHHEDVRSPVGASTPATATSSLHLTGFGTDTHDQTTLRSGGVWQEYGVDFLNGGGWQAPMAEGTLDLSHPTPYMERTVEGTTDTTETRDVTPTPPSGPPPPQGARNEKTTTTTTTTNNNNNNNNTTTLHPPSGSSMSPPHLDLCERVVSDEEVDAYINELQELTRGGGLVSKASIFYTSSYTGYGVREMFASIAESIARVDLEYRRGRNGERSGGGALPTGVVGLGSEPPLTTASTPVKPEEVVPRIRLHEPQVNANQSNRKLSPGRGGGGGGGAYTEPGYGAKGGRKGTGAEGTISLRRGNPGLINDPDYNSPNYARPHQQQYQRYMHREEQPARCCS